MRSTELLPVNNRYQLLAAVALFLMLAPPILAGETIVDAARGFTLTLPDGFVSRSDLIESDSNVVHAFVLGDLAGEQLAMILYVEALGYEIQIGERLERSKMPPSFEGRLFTTQWHDLELDLVEVPQIDEGVKTLTYNVPVPLKKSAIQLSLLGPADREAEIRTQLAQILGGLHGESNWTNTPVASSVDYGTILLAFAVVSILGGLVALWLISRVAPKGIVLAIAIGIYYSGIVLFAGVQLRELVMLRGALKMLGVAGIILGIIDLIRKRKPPHQSPVDVSSSPTGSKGAS